MCLMLGFLMILLPSFFNQCFFLLFSPTFHLLLLPSPLPHPSTLTLSSPCTSPFSLPPSFSFPFPLPHLFFPSLLLLDLIDRMSVWILDGVVWHSSLLPFALNKNSIMHTTVMLVVDMSQPWAIPESLERWADVLRKHIDCLKIEPKAYSEMRNACKYLRALYYGQWWMLCGCMWVWWLWRWCFGEWWWV